MRPGKVLQAILDEKGITHICLAENLGVKPQAIDKRCKSDTNMKIDTLIKTYASVGYQLVAISIDGEGPEYELGLC